MSRRSRRGFSLIELVLASIIMLMVAGFGLYSLQGGRQSAETRGLAEEVAEELKAVRQQAISTRSPVAVVFPSSNGATGKSQSLYVVEGRAIPRVVRSLDFSDTYPGSCFFWGNWGGAPDSSSPVNANTEKFELAKWSPLPRPRDYHLIFTPTGTVTSNGLPLFTRNDGVYGLKEYRLLVSNGVREAGGGGGVLPLFSPSGVHKASTICISQTGAVALSPGVVGAAVPDDPSVQVGLVAASPMVADAADSSPRIVKLQAEPLPKDAPGSGAVTVIPKSGYITLLVEAESPSGEPLEAVWSGEGPGGGGAFSSLGASSMTWNTETNRWEGRWTWTPPGTTSKGDNYRLTCRVTDRSGDSAVANLGASGSAEVVADQHVALALYEDDGEYTHCNLAKITPEGTDVFAVRLPEDIYDAYSPVWSPNGDKLAFLADSDLGKSVYLVNADGTELTNLYTVDGDVQDDFGIAFSPDGSYIAFTAYGDDSMLANVVVCRADRSGTPPWVYDVDQDHWGVSWHPTQNLLLCEADVYDGNNIDNDLIKTKLRVISFPSGAKTDLLTEDEVDDETGIAGAHWSRNGNKVVYVNKDNLWTANLTYATPGSLPTMDTPTNLTPGSSGPALPTTPRFCDADNRIAVLDYDEDSDDIDLWVYDGSSWSRRVNGLSIVGFNWSPDGENLVFSAGPAITGFGLLEEGEDDFEEPYVPTRCYIVPSSGPGGYKEITPKGFTHADLGAPSWWSSN